MSIARISSAQKQAIKFDSCIPAYTRSNKVCVLKLANKWNFYCSINQAAPTAKEGTRGKQKLFANNTKKQHSENRCSNLWFVLYMWSVHLHRFKWNKMEHFQVCIVFVQSTVQLEKDRNTDLLNTNAADLLVERLTRAVTKCCTLLSIYDSQMNRTNRAKKNSSSRVFI